VQKIGAPVAKAAVYVFAFVSWAIAMLLIYNMAGMVFRGHIEEYWFAILLLMFGAGVFFWELSRYVIKQGIPQVASFFQPVAPGGADGQNSTPLMTKDTTAMAKNETPSYTFTAPVTITNATNHNAAGGIISNAPVTVNHYYDKSKPTPSTIDAEIIEPATVVPEAETASLDELVAYTETHMGRAVAENTVRNVLERNAVESCGEEKRGKARAKLYPKERAEKVLSDYVTINKRK
jgi:hypothetical protein